MLGSKEKKLYKGPVGFSGKRTSDSPWGSCSNSLKSHSFRFTHTEFGLKVAFAYSKKKIYLSTLIVNTLRQVVLLIINDFYLLLKAISLECLPEKAVGLE